MINSEPNEEVTICFFHEYKRMDSIYDTSLISAIHAAQRRLMQIFYPLDEPLVILAFQSEPQ